MECLTRLSSWSKTKSKRIARSLPCLRSGTSVPCIACNQQRLADYFAHIAEAIERIGHYTVRMDEVAFLSNQLVQDAAIRNMEIVGEASSNIKNRFLEFSAAHPELPLSFA